MRILVIGPTPPPLGGASLRVRQLLDGLRDDPGIAVQHIETHISGRRPQNLRRFLKGVDVLLRVVIRAPWSDVVTVHLNQRGRFFLAPGIWLLTRLLGVPMVLRVFGGEFSSQIRALPKWLRWLSERTICRSEVILVQTRTLFSDLQGLCQGKLSLLPNYASGAVLNEGRSGKRVSESEKCSKFVYLGRVCRVKGIEELLKAARAGGFEFTIDIWGPLEEEYSAFSLEERGGGRVRYKGVCEPDSVIEILQQYDCLVLPSYHPGEGHPAVILESFCAGIPVIATRWRGIPEIVDQTTGILIDPHDWEGLHQSMIRLYSEPSLWQGLAGSARDRCGGGTFQEHLRVFLESCRHAAGGHFGE